MRKIAYFLIRTTPLHLFPNAFETPPYTVGKYRKSTAIVFIHRDILSFWLKFLRQFQVRWPNGFVGAVLQTLKMSACLVFT